MVSDFKLSILALRSSILVFSICLLCACGPKDGVKRVTLRPDGDLMAFSTTELTFTSGETVELTFENTATSPSMVHNFVLLADSVSIDEVGLLALQAGPENGYLPDNTAILAYTRLAGPGEQETVRFTVPAPGTYDFVCLYPGHWVTMRGKLISTSP